MYLGKRFKNTARNRHEWASGWVWTEKGARSSWISNSTLCSLLICYSVIFTQSLLPNLPLSNAVSWLWCANGPTHGPLPETHAYWCLQMTRNLPLNLLAPIPGKRRLWLIWFILLNQGTEAMSLASQWISLPWVRYPSSLNQWWSQRLRWHGAIPVNLGVHEWRPR